MMDVFWEFLQERRIGRSERKAEQAHDTVESLRLELDVAQRRIESLTMMSQGLWELLREQVGLTDEALETKIKEIDMRDGVADGRMNMVVEPRTCPACNRSNHARHLYCLYCGEPLGIDSLGQHR